MPAPPTTEELERIMINADTPAGTRVVRRFDGMVGTLVWSMSSVADRVTYFSVKLDGDDTPTADDPSIVGVWSGTAEAWDLAAMCKGSTMPVGVASRCQSCGLSFGYPHPANLVVGWVAPMHVNLTKTSKQRAQALAQELISLANVALDAEFHNGEHHTGETRAAAIRARGNLYRKLYNLTDSLILGED